jgi:pimeloyl-ACP methyl ester carboxylesterase
MTPLRFGPSSRQIYGLFRPSLQPAQGAITPLPGVLLCQPWGQEAVRTQRLFRALGERLSRLGYPVLQFDYLGTGDADGEDADGNLQQWTQDTALAHEQLIDLCGHTRTAWLGLRLGATLATLASARVTTPPRRLILWDPIHDGSAYLQDMANGTAHYLQEAYAQRWDLASQLLDRQELSATQQAFGFAISAQLQADLQALTPEAFLAGRATDITLLTHKTHPGQRPLQQALLSSGIPTRSLTAAEHINWASDEAMNTAIVPQGILAQLMDQLQTLP